jgi:hypothetical protein
MNRTIWTSRLSFRIFTRKMLLIIRLAFPDASPALPWWDKPLWLELKRGYRGGGNEGCQSLKRPFNNLLDNKLEHSISLAPHWRTKQKWVKRYIIFLDINNIRHRPREMRFGIEEHPMPLSTQQPTMSVSTWSSLGIAMLRTWRELQSREDDRFRQAFTYFASSAAMPFVLFYFQLLPPF